MTGVRVNCICPVIVDTPLIRGGLENAAVGKEMMKVLMLKLIEQQEGYLRYYIENTFLSSKFCVSYSPEFVAEGIIKLITDTSLSRKIMCVTPRKGHHFQEYKDIQHVLDNC